MIEWTVRERSFMQDVWSCASPLQTWSDDSGVAGAQTSPSLQASSLESLPHLLPSPRFPAAVVCRASRTAQRTLQNASCWRRETSCDWWSIVFFRVEWSVAKAESEYFSFCYDELMRSFHSWVCCPVRLAFFLYPRSRPRIPRFDAGE